MGTITSANTSFSLGIASVFPVPVPLQGFAADDIFDTDPLESAEVMMGVDGVLSAGFVFVPVKMSITLQADSASNLVFDAWYAAQQAAKEVFSAFGVVIFPTLGTKYALINGILSTYKPTPDAKRVLQPRKFAITWQSTPVAVV